MEEAVAADAPRVGVGASVALEVVITLLNLAVGNARAAAGDEAYRKRAPKVSRRRLSSCDGRLGGRTGSRLVAAAAEAIAPLTTLSGDWEVFSVPVAAGLDHHGGLRLTARMGALVEHSRRARESGSLLRRTWLF